MKTELFEAETPDYRRTWIFAVPVLAFAFFIVGQILVLLPIKYLGLGLGKDIRRNYLYGFGLGLLMAASVVYAVRLFGGFAIEAQVDLQLRNLAPLVSDLMPTPEAAVWLTGGMDGPEGSVLTPVVLALGCVWLIRSLRRNLSSEHQ